MWLLELSAMEIPQMCDEKLWRQRDPEPVGMGWREARESEPNK